METNPDRPAPSPAKLLDQFNDWAAGTELPGRTMAYLKTGHLPDVLADLGSDEALSMLESWNGWEKGTTRPEIVLEALKEHGIVEVLTAMSA